MLCPCSGQVVRSQPPGTACRAPTFSDRMMESCGISEVGLVRSHNEDSFVVDDALGLYAVADGMGGALAGETASSIAAETLTAEVRQAGRDASADTLVGAVELANRNVRWEAEHNPAYQGMGTTLVAVLVRLPRIHLVSVGDSRAYRWSQGELSQLTSDHSWAAEVGQGLGLSAQQLKSHPYRNVLTRAVGSDEKIEVTAEEVSMLPGDLLLLSSDGLHGVAGAEKLGEVLSQAESLEARCQALIEAVLANGAPDNATAVLVERTDTR